MAKVQNEMATRITIDSIGAVKSYKALTDAVKASMNAWKASEVQLKSAGNYQEAAKAKVEGLTKSIDLQKGKLSELKARQQDIDKSTKEGQEAYFKLENQITSATKQLGNYEGQLKRAKSSATYYTSGLAELQKGYKQSTNASKAYTDRLEAEGKQAEAGKAKLAGLKQSYANLYAQLKLQKDELTKVASESGLTSEKYAKQRVRVEETTTAMAKQKSEIASLTVKYGTMSDKMVKLSDKAALVKDKFRTVASGFKSVATAASVGVAGVTAASVAGAKKASTLQNIYKQNQNLLVTSGDSAKSAIKAVTEMQKDGQQYSVKYGLSQKEIAEQYQDLIKRGHTAKESLAVMKTELQASVASGNDFQDVVKVSSQVLEAFGMKTNNTAKMMASTKRVVNDLAYSADVTATDFHSLGKGMEYVGDSANNAGFSVEETSAALGELSNHGLEADKAGTGLRKTINSLADPSDAATGALKKIGITSTKVFQKSNGDFKSMSDIMAIMEKHTKNLGGAEKAAVFKAIFGATGMQAAQILAVNNKELASLTSQVTKAGKEGDYVQKLANKNSSTAQMNVKRFKEAAEALEIMMGAKLLPTMTEAADDMTKAFNNKSTQKGLTFLINNVKNLLNGMLKVVEFMGNHTKTVTAFGAALGGVWALAKVNKFIKLIKEMRANFGLVNDTVKSQSIVKTVEAETAAISAQNDVLKTNNELESGTEVSTGDTRMSQHTKSASKSGYSNVANDVASNGNRWDLTGIKNVEKETEKASSETSRWSNVVSKFKSGFSKAFSGLGFIVKRAGTIASAAIEGWNLASSVAKTLKKPSAKNKISLESKATGSLIGAGIGAALGGPEGAIIGSAIAEQISSSKTVQKAVKATHNLVSNVRKDYTAQKGTEYALLGTVRTSTSATKHQYENSKVRSNSTMTSVSEFQKAAKSDGITDNSSSIIKSVKKSLSSLPESAFKAGESAAKKLKSAFKKTNLNFDKLEFSVDNKSLSKAMKDSKSGYKAITDTVVNYAKSNESKSKKTLQAWVKSGMMSKQDAKTALANEKSYYDGRIKSAKNSVSKLESVDKDYYKSAKQENSMHSKAMTGINKSYGSTITKLESTRNKDINKLTQGYYVKYKGQYLSGQSGIAKINKIYGTKIKNQEKEKNSAINDENKRHQTALNADANAAYKRRLKLLSNAEAKTDLVIQNGSSKQKSILNTLAKSSGKISEKQADKLVNEAYRTYKGVVKHADNTYKGAKNAATKKYKSTVAAAQTEYYQNHSISKKQMDRIVANATTQYKDTVKQAKNQRDDTTKHAKQQYTNVTKQASKQMKDHDYYVDKETGHVKSKWSTLGGSLSGIWGGIKSGFNSLLSLFGAKSSSSKSSSSSSSTTKAKAKSGDTGHRIEANAVGGKVRNGMALVGEAGAELAYEPYSGTARLLGENGPEITRVARSEIILPADKTKQVLSGSYGKGQTLPGYATGFLGEAEKLAKSTVNIGETALDKISNMVSAPIKWVEKNILGKIKWPGFNDSWTLKGATAVKDATIDKVKDFVKSLADKLSDFGGGIGNVKLSGSIASRARALAKAFKQGYPASKNGGIAGILGNWVQESNLNPSAVNSSDHGTGLGQWTFTRETALRSWLRKHGYAWNSAAGQIGYALNEPGENGMLKAVLRMTSPTAAAQKFFATWESGGAMDSTGGARLSNASAVYRYIKGMENGGLVDKDQIIRIAEHNKPEMVLPLTNKSRANQLIAQASQVVNGNTSTQVASTNSESNEKLDKLISLMSAILGNMGSVQAVIAKSDVVNAVKSDNKTTSQYSQMMGY
ncbi:phage tail tape measure protein [Lactiplantibacillus plantarum]|uniref:phage tail tape measure protein n=1 Tax=Lactiplantibacillus plantarum TaxID=1590 RepID=UPI00189E6881|nr:phage tail tape measure protein [Lactiplantibacillus plantarum]MDB7778542.1 phage tail tape measure protein [Lactiplantibacillus plantarum]MDB7787519.1 phage tail tape measure protein [Lactiplantibacillus plantarum]MDB7790517.1 phage tail tape measure protein [Lactiplantibacillus plantarum]